MTEAVQFLQQRFSGYLLHSGTHKSWSSSMKPTGSSVPNETRVWVKSKPNGGGPRFL